MKSKNDEMGRLERFLDFCARHTEFTIISVISFWIVTILFFAVWIGHWTYTSSLPETRMQECLDSELFNRDECATLILEEMKD